MQKALDINTVIGKAKKGDQNAFKTIYDMYWRYVLFIATKICRNEVDAQDILQDVFLKVFKNLHQIDDEEKIKPWISIITTRECYNYLKKAKKFATDAEDSTVPEDMIDLDEDFIPEAYLQKKELSQRLIKIIDSLPTRQREAIFLYYYVGMKTNEIAQTQQCSIENVRKALYDARRNIKSKIEKDKDKKGAFAFTVAFVSFFAFFVREQETFAMRPSVLPVAEAVFLVIVKKLNIIQNVTYVGLVSAVILFACVIVLDVLQDNSHYAQSYPYLNTISASQGVHPPGPLARLLTNRDSNNEKITEAMLISNYHAQNTQHIQNINEEVHATNYYVGNVNNKIPTVNYYVEDYYAEEATPTVPQEPVQQEPALPEPMPQEPTPPPEYIYWSPGVAAGYDFLGWVTGETAAGLALGYSMDGVATVTPYAMPGAMPDTNITYVAVWGDKNTNIIGNPATRSLVVNNLPDIIVIGQSPISNATSITGTELEWNAGTATGYDFLGWVVGEVAAELLPGSNISDVTFVTPPVYMPAEGIVYYAVWGNASTGIIGR